MNGIPDAICFKDKERRYTRLNDAERSILNVENAVDAIGRTADGFVPSALAQKRRMEEEHVLATGEPLVDCVETLMGPDGKALWLSATKAPIRARGRYHWNRRNRARHHREQAPRAIEKRVHRNCQP